MKISKTVLNYCRNVADIDLWVGGLAETNRSKEAIVGPTLSCIIANQFQALKIGDRFFYENAPNASLGTTATAFTLGIIFFSFSTFLFFIVF